MKFRKGVYSGPMCLKTRPLQDQNVPKAQVEAKIESKVSAKF